MANLRADNLTGTGGRNAIDGSVFFDGVSRLELDGSSDFAFGTGDFTIEMWIKINDDTNTNTLYDSRPSGSNGAQIAIFYSGSSNAILFAHGGTVRITGTVDVGADHAWHHISLNRESGSTKLFVDGVQDGSTYSSDTTDYLNPSNRPRIGASSGSTDLSAPFSKGYISNLRVCKGHAVYNSNYTPPTQKLELHAESVLLCCQDSDNALQEATGKTITGYGRYANTDTELVTNHSFNNGTTGWTLSDASEGSMAVVNGSLVLTNDDSSDPPVYAWQAVTTVVGQTYDLKVHFSGGTGTPGSNLAIYLNTSSSFGSSAGGSMTADSVSGNGIKIHRFKATVATTYLILRVNANAAGTSIFSAASIKASDYGKAPKVLPPYGIDEGVVFDGYTKVNSPGVMYFPTGDTAQRGRGRAVFGLANAPSNVNNIEYVQIQSEGNAVDFGDLITAQTAGGAGSSSTRGIFGGGQISPGKTNVISYVTIATTSNATDFGDLSVVRDFVGGLSNSTRGLFLGGRIDPASANSDTVDYVTIASTGNAADFGNLQSIRHGGAGCASPTRGLFGGGNPPNGGMNTIDYFTIASTGNGTDYGDLSVARVQPASLSSSTRGIWSGGTTPSHSDVIDYVTIASTGNAADFGNLTVARRGHGAATNSLRGIFNSGEGSPALVNTIDYVTIATTGNATDFGDCTLARLNNAGCSDSHGGLS